MAARKQGRSDAVASIRIHRLATWLQAAAVALPLWAIVAGAAELPTVAVLPFELIDDQHELAPATVEYARLPVIARQLGEGLQAKGLYRVLNTQPAQALIDDARSRENLRDCNGCELTIGKKLKADRVLIGWVQKVSNLILNINIRVEAVSTGAVVLQKSVDIRGNTDDSWRRGVDALLRDMVEKRQIGR
jgi:hypothetical protein